MKRLLAFALAVAFVTSPPALHAEDVKITKGKDAVEFRVGDAFVFGAETRGLAPELLGQFAPEMRLRLPMLAGNRSVNLSNAVAVVVFEAWRQNGYAGGS